jgi:hypothetical protein
MEETIMAAAPPPMRLVVTEKMLRNFLFGRGITHWSTDLTDVCNALHVLETQPALMSVKAQALSRAFNKWKNSNHLGELSVLENSAEYRGIEAFVARYPVALAPPAPLPADASDSGLKPVGVALYCVLNKHENFKLGLNERLHHMQNAVAYFNNMLKALPSGSLQEDNSFLGIFIAPEYYFTRPSKKGEREFLDLKSKDMLDVQLKKLSEAFPRILLIPGTIHYEARMTTADTFKAGEQLLLAASDKILREESQFRAKAPFSAPVLANPKAVLDYTMDHYDANAALPNHGGRTIEERDAPSLNRLADVLLDKRNKPRWVHNVTSLLLNGKMWGTYDKHTDFYESKSISPEKSLFVPGTREQSPVIGDAVRKFRFGVEICFDHANGVLKHLNPGNLAFHIVVSDSVGNEEGHMAMRNSGWFLHASTNITSNKIYRREYGTPVPYTNVLNWQAGKQGANQLGTALIPLPVPWTEAAPNRAPDARRWRSA